MIRKLLVGYRTSAIVAACLAAPSIAHAVSTPAIRTSASNQMPACVTPQRLDTFLSSQIRKRGYRLTPNHRSIAKWYRKHGEAHRIRWDYAFFQMALETNFLSFRRGNGKRGDVHPRQNNFAGLGTTGGGVPGDSYPDASTGVLAQIQHLVVYSGERLRRPVGHRTRLKQSVILQSVKKVVRRRPMTFADLAGRWAADKRYGRSIKRLANLFYSEHCRGDQTRTTRTSSASTAPGSKPRPQDTSRAERARTSIPIRKTTTAPAARLTNVNRSKHLAVPKPTRASRKAGAAAPPTRTRCHVQVASYGGTRAVLIESVSADTVHLTALNVQPGFEDAMTQNFIQSHAPSGKPIGTFENRAAAVAKAKAVCRKRTAKLRQ